MFSDLWCLCCFDYSALIVSYINVDLWCLCCFDYSALIVSYIMFSDFGVYVALTIQL